MKILYISNDDTGGNNYFISQAVRKHTPHETKAAKMMKSYLDYPTEIFAPSIRKIRNLYKWADIIHLRNGWEFLPSGYEKKKVIITFTNVSYRRQPDILTDICRRKGWTVAVSTIDLVKWRQALWFPNPRVDMLGRGEKHSQFAVCHAPTKRERKGTATIIEALKGMDVGLELIENTPYAECLKRRARCHLTIDQFLYGYGNSAIEAWSLGQPVLTYYQQEPDVPFHIEREGAEIPWLDTPETVRAIRNNVLRVRDDEKLRDELIRAGRAWYEKHHSEQAVARRAVEIYGMVLNA